MNIALILAAGNGTRMGASSPKQFIELDNKPLIVYTVEAFNRCENIDYIVLVTNDGFVDQVSKWVKEYNLEKVKFVIKGGITRQESVRNGLVKLKDENTDDNDNILIHDGARVLVSQEIINSNIELCNLYHAVDTVVPSTDSVISTKDNLSVYSMPLRSEIYCSQTPQTFKFGLIYEAHMEDTSLEATDDCRLIYNLGHKIFLAKGEKKNFKVTTKEDLELLKLLIKK